MKHAYVRTTVFIEEPDVAILAGMDMHSKDRAGKDGILQFWMRSVC